MIPKVIHYIWIGNNKEPEIFQHSLKSWKKHCPDYKIMCWDESNIDFNISNYTKETYINKKYGHVGDYYRLWILYNYGGIYLDVDVELLKPIDHLLSYDSFFSFQDHKRINLGNGFGSIRANRLLKIMIDEYDRLFSSSSFINSLKTSPEIDTTILKSTGLKPNNQIQIIDNNIFLPREYMSPKSFYSKRTYITKKTISIHHFDGSWTYEKQKSNYTFLFYILPSYVAEKLILVFEKTKILFNKF
jgi:mannosyltransferase OCH1-like enzyme